jgi:hypothetical protein
LLFCEQISEESSKIFPFLKGPIHPEFNRKKVKKVLLPCIIITFALHFLSWVSKFLKHIFLHCRKPFEKCLLFALPTLIWSSQPLIVLCSGNWPSRNCCTVRIWEQKRKKVFWRLEKTRWSYSSFLMFSAVSVFRRFRRSDQLLADFIHNFRLCQPIGRNDMQKIWKVSFKKSR